MLRIALLGLLVGFADAFMSAPLLGIRHCRASITRSSLRCSASDPQERREVLGPLAAAGLSLFSAPASSWAKPKGSAGGKWASHFGEFAEEELEGFTETASGLKIKDVEVGSGAQPLSGQSVTAHYAGYLLSSGNKFDASYERNKPLTFKVGVGQVIKGWDEALLGMKIGGRRMLIIPPQLAYGKKGAGGVIPPDSVLVFYVELLGVAP